MEKLGRDTFLYMEPPEGYYKPQEFAQCETCRKYIRESVQCIELGPNPRITDDKSCCLYSPWPLGKPNPEVVRNHLTELRQAEKRGAHDFVTPEEAGLVQRQVRCENCYYFDEDDSDCELYEMLNKAFPQCFDLEERVKPLACCNAQTKRGGSKISEDLSERILSQVSKLLR